VSEQAAAPLQARPTIADILVAHGFVTEEDLAGALEVSDRTGQPLGQVLVAAGTITRLELASALAEQWSDPDSSITLLPRPSPQPPGVRVAAPEAPPDLAAGDDAAYLGRLHDAVADLARRVGAAEPLLAEMERRTSETDADALEPRLSALAGQLEAALRRVADVEGALGATADQVEGLTEGVEQAFAALQSGTGELAERLGVIASIVETAPTSGDLSELRTAVGDLASRPLPDEGLGARLDDVAATLGEALTTLGTLGAAVEELAARPRASPELPGRLQAVQDLVAELAARPAIAPELEQRLQELAERPPADPALPGRLDELVARVETQDTLYDTVAGELRASIEAVAARPAADIELGERLDELSGRVGELGAQVESLAAVATSGDDGIAIEELRSSLEELARRRAGDDETTERLDALTEAVEELRTRPQTDRGLADRVEEIAATTASLAEYTDLAKLAASVEALANRADTGDATLRELGRQVEALTERPVLDPGAAARLDALGEAVSALRADDATARLHEDVEAIRARLAADDASLSELRAAAAELAARPAGDPELAARLAALGTRVEELAAQGAAAAESSPDTTQVDQLGVAVASLQAGIDTTLDGIVARLDALETAPSGAPDDAPTAEAAWAAEAAKLAERLDDLTARLEDGAGAAPAAAQAAGAAPPPRRLAQPAEPGDETEQELERLRMAIERMSLHLGEQERAIAEVMRSRGVTQRLDELEARIDDVAAGAVAVGAPAADGSIPAATSGGPDMRALIRRLDSAEEALEAERDKLLTKLERIASSLDWRMRRLESGDDPTA
jgi:tetrahydromethanopterin S-methyltransferase subunit G